MLKLNVIAIDGPAASGKSTVAEKIAARLGGHYINTGNMYRAVTLSALRNGLTSPFSGNDIAKMLGKVDIDYLRRKDGTLFLAIDGKPAGSEIRSPEVAQHVSEIAAMPEVRSWLVERQRKFAALGTIIMEGRDIGTVVFPDARHKFFLTASPEVRALRRLNQSGETADGATVASVAREIAARDEKDSRREVAPLRKADDAVLIDCSDMTVDEVVDKMVSTIRTQIADSGKGGMQA